MTLDNIAQVAIPNGTRHRGPFAPTSCAFVTDSETSSSCLSRATNGCVVPTTTDALFRGDVPCIPWRKNAKVAVEPSGVIHCILCFLETGSGKDPTFHDRKKIPATC